MYTFYFNGHLPYSAVRPLHWRLTPSARFLPPKNTTPSQCRYSPVSFCHAEDITGASCVTERNGPSSAPVKSCFLSKVWNRNFCRNCAFVLLPWPLAHLFTFFNFIHYLVITTQYDCISKWNIKIAVSQAAGQSAWSPLRLGESSRPRFSPSESAPKRVDRNFTSPIPFLNIIPYAWNSWYNINGSCPLHGHGAPTLLSQKGALSTSGFFGWTGILDNLPELFRKKEKKSILLLYKKWLIS